LAGFLLLSFLLSLFACGRAGYRDIRDYYFPLKSLTEGLVYEYRAVGGDAPAEHKYYRSFIEDKQVSLTVTQYDGNLLPSVFTREKLADNGMQVEELVLLYPDSSGKQIQVPAEVEAADVFPFRVKEEGGIYLFRVSWADPADSTHVTTLIQNRYFDGDTTITFQGESYPAVRFLLREGLDDEQEGVLSIEYESREVYAKGLGLVYYEKAISEDFVLRYELADRYEMRVLEGKFREMME
jgi:hypothetical protein